MAKELTRYTSIAHSLMATRNESGSGVVSECLRMLDPERFSSIPGIANTFATKSTEINADMSLSAVGKSERIRAAASTALGNIATIARRVVELEKGREVMLEDALELKKPDASETLVDLAIAAHIRAEEPIPTKLRGMSTRIRTAVARLPAELSGLSPDVHSSVVGSLISPDLSVKFSEEADALSSTRAVVQAAIDQLVPVAQWEAPEMVKSFRTDWSLPGVYHTKVARLHSEFQVTESENLAA